MSGDYSLVFPTAAFPEPAATDRIRLIPSKSSYLIFSSETRHAASVSGYETVILSREHADGPRNTQFTVRHLLAVSPDWDVALQPDGGYLLAVTTARGGNNALAAVNRDGTQIALRGARSSDNLDSQRFVRRPNADPDARVSAIMNGRDVVLFDPGHAPAANFRPVARAAAAVIVQSAGGFSLIGKALVPGAVRGQDISPGMLFHTKLDAEFKVVGKPQPLLESATVFEFDAEALEDGVAVFATTGPGASALVFSAAGNRMEGMATTQVVSPLPLTSPTILLARGSIHLAALTGVGLAGAELRVGELK